MSIFNDTISLYKNFLKEGNTLLFYVDITRNNENTRIVIRKIEDLEKIYNNQNFKVNIYLSDSNDFNLLNNFLTDSKDKNSLFIFFQKNGKLISFDFSNNYKISDFSKLDKLNHSKKIDYSLEFQ